MKNQINSRDYELISAYLDNQQGSKERALFEERLKAEAGLRNELHEISTTRLMLRRLPRQHAPRNYFVSAQAVRARPTLKLAPIFGIVSAVASVLLALLIFGSTFLSPASQVALAPALSVPNESVASQPEISRSTAAAPITSTEAAPAIMSGAQIQASPTPFIPEATTTPPESATPTTIYIYVYPPSTTAVNPMAIANAPTEMPTLTCDEYWSAPLPSSADIYVCPTPTGTLSKYLESILSTSTPTPTYSPTLSASPTPMLTATPSPTETVSPTETPTLTATPAPTDTFIPAETPVPPALGAPPQSQKSVPVGSEESATEITSPNQLLGAGNPTQAAQDQTKAPYTAPNYSFLSYLLLTVEISLAVIAVIAGITAIILRIRAH
jgi:hypothetical protein